ncbi:MAG: hypothetical protein JOZ90_17040 [Alphaproteobacteria bacterium]|nr:hypothetical protein [Alphaproteobacteria bacterium]MBV9371481.1 hypothetical protein [Alphaproteobacteria bacterium]MBV9902777.1 hypothetical protein [Alphaproteobacteria bacterium]
MGLRAFLPLAGLAALAACGGSSESDNAADRLDRAAGQSTPEAADVLENAADQVRDSNVADPDAAVQNALQSAGNAQAPRPGGAKPPAAGGGG